MASPSSSGGSPSWDEGFSGVLLPRSVQSRPNKTRREALWISPPQRERSFLREARSRYEGGIKHNRDGGSTELFELLLSLSSDSKKRSAIPRIIHHIWFGPVEKLSAEAKRCMDTWRRLNPGFEFVLWTDESVEKAFKSWNEPIRALEACPNNGEKSDVARYAILFHVGGIYLDVDVECLRPLDDAILDSFDLIASFANVDSACEIGNSCLMLRPGHPFMKHMFQQCFSMAAEVSRATLNSKEDTIARTGPGALTREWAFKIFMEPGWLILPPSYVYPVPNDVSDTELERTDWERPESFAVHWWHKSW